MTLWHLHHASSDLSSVFHEIDSFGYAKRVCNNSRALFHCLMTIKSG
jgi:hypothetical protein